MIPVYIERILREERLFFVELIEHEDTIGAFVILNFRIHTVIYLRADEGLETVMHAVRL